MVMEEEEEEDEDEDKKGMKRTQRISRKHRERRR